MPKAIFVGFRVFLRIVILTFRSFRKYLQIFLTKKRPSFRSGALSLCRGFPYRMSKAKGSRAYAVAGAPGCRALTASESAANGVPERT